MPLGITPLSGGSDYYQYVSEAATLKGEWRGEAAERLGLRGEVTAEDFEAVRLRIGADGRPITGRSDGDRVYGDRTYRPIRLYDFCFGVTKGVSIMALQDQRLVEAQAVSSRLLAAEIERCAKVRVQESGRWTVKPAAGMVMSQWQHQFSRALDPQLHAHLVAGNLAWDGEEKRWKALQASEIFARRNEGYLEKFYSETMRMQVERLGYSTEVGRYSFELQGIPQELRDKFSQRGRQFAENLALFQTACPSYAQKQVAVRMDRPEKLIIDMAEVRAGVWERMTTGERNLVAGLHENALTRQYSVDMRHTLDVGPFLQVSGPGAPGASARAWSENALVESARRVAFHDTVGYEPGLYRRPWEYAQKADHSVGVGQPSIRQRSRYSM